MYNIVNRVLATCLKGKRPINLLDSVGAFQEFYDIHSRRLHKFAYLIDVQYAYAAGHRMRPICPFETSGVKFILDFFVSNKLAKNIRIKIIADRDISETPLQLSKFIINNYPEFIYRYMGEWVNVGARQSSIFIGTNVKSINVVNSFDVKYLKSMPKLRIITLDKDAILSYDNKYQWYHNYTILGLFFHEKSYRLNEISRLKDVLQRNHRLQMATIECILSFIAIKRFDRSNFRLFEVDRFVIRKIGEYMLSFLFDESHLKELSVKLNLEIID